VHSQGQIVAVREQKEVRTMAISVGEQVRVVNREAIPADQKSGLFYNHFRNLVGAVDRVYDDGTVCVIVDHSTLTRELMLRLKRAERLIKPRWKTLSSTGAIEAETEPEPTPATAAADYEEEVEGGVVAAAAPSEAAWMEAATEGGIKTGLKYAIVLRTSDLQPVS
jgi:hypothetical protein